MVRSSERNGPAHLFVAQRSGGEHGFRPISFLWVFEIVLRACSDRKRSESRGAAGRVALVGQPPGEGTRDGAWRTPRREREGKAASHQERRAILQATDEIRSMPGRRRVSLTLTPSFAAGWLLPLLQDFKAKHSDVELDLVTTTRVVDLARENVDLAIRRGSGSWPDCVAEPLMREVLIPVVAPGTWKSLGCDTIEQAFGATRVLVNTTMFGEWDRFCEARGVASPPVECRFNLETYELTVQAARDGLGIALGRRPLIDNLLQSGELIAPAGNSGPDLHG
jgi:DNA-binding transcriptional LysR family regulator